MARSTTQDKTTDAGRTRRGRRILRRLLIVAAVIVVLMAGAALWLRQALPRIAATQIGRLLNAHVETGAFVFRRDGSVSVANLVVRPNREKLPYDDTILLAQNVYATFSRRSLLRLSPQVTSIRVENFTLDVQLDLGSGRWNIGTLRFNGPRGGGGDIPTISLQRGKLRYGKISGADTEVVMSIPIEASFGREIDAYPSYAFEIKTAKLSGGYGDSHLRGHWRPQLGLTEPAELTVAGGLSSTDIPSLERAWAIDVLAGVLQYDRTDKYSLDLSLKDLHGKHAPEMDMLRYIAPAMANEAGPVQNLQKFFAEYQPTGTVGSISIRASGNLKKLNQSEITGQLVCKDISVCDSEFPYQIDHLSGELEFTQSMVRANRLVGKHGPVDIGIDGWTRETSGGRQYQYQVTSRNMVLDKALYAALDSEQKQLWDAFRPSGTVSVDYRLTRTSPTDKRLYLSVDLNDVNAAFQGFPYPLAGLTGNLFFDLESTTILDVVSKAGGRQIRINGKVTERSGGKPMYYVTVDAKDVPLDAALRDALPAQHRELFRRFDLGGLADMRARVFTMAAQSATGRSASGSSAGGDANGLGDPNDASAVSFLADVVCREGSLKLPAVRQEPASRAPGMTEPKPPVESGPANASSLVLSNITAEATITPDSLNIRKLDGRYGRSSVAMAGGVRFGEDSRLRQCYMKITAQQVPLDEALIGLLPSSAMRQVAAFHPQGDMNLVVEYKKADSNEPPEYSAVVDCLGDKINHERFAYPFTDIRGTLSLTKDGIVLKNITAKPDDGGQKAEGTGHGTEPSSVLGPPSSGKPPVIRVDGSATVTHGRLEKGSFTLKATDVLFTEALGRALPKTSAGLYRELSPQGPFDLDLSTLEVSRGAADEMLLRFGGKANLSACHLKLSGAETELSGALEAEGSYSTKHGFLKGQARLAGDRLTVKGKAVTHMNVAAAYDPNTQRWTAENFVGRCYGGKLLGSLEVGKTGPVVGNGKPAADHQPLEYMLRVALNDVDLQQFLQAGKSQDTEQPSSALHPPSSGLSSTSSGTMDAWLSLRSRMGEPKRDDSRPGASGAGSSMARADSSAQGVCHVNIASMQVGKVSPLGNVVSVLRLSEPTDYTFERMLIDSYIQSNKLLISKLDLSGRSSAFTGSGTMDLASEEINLTLTARGRRGSAAKPSMLQSLTEGLGGAVVRMEVTGRAGNPRVETKTLPLIEDSLRILGAPQ